MSKAITTLLLFMIGISLQAQTADTTIYQTVEEMPRFPGCEQLDTTIAVKQQCANQQLLGFMYSNIRYPQQAIEENIEGTVVLTFVVEKDGTISSPRILKDIGGGTGIEALRVASQMNAAGVRWIPGKKDGQAVRTQFNLPVRFKIEDPLPYTLVGRDTVYTQYDEPLEFIGGQDSLTAYLNRRLKYPTSAADTCIVGRLEVQVLVHPDKRVRILDITDYNDLGFDFWYEAIAATTSTYGMWKPAVYEGRKVPASFEMSLVFNPVSDACRPIVERYEQALQLAQEGADLFNEEQQEAGIAKLSEAVEMFPNDASFLMVRGQAYLDSGRMSEACADLQKVRRITLLKWYDNILPLICSSSNNSGE